MDRTFFGNSFDGALRVSNLYCWVALKLVRYLRMEIQVKILGQFSAYPILAVKFYRYKADKLPRAFTFNFHRQTNITE